MSIVGVHPLSLAVTNLRRQDSTNILQKNPLRVKTQTRGSVAGNCKYINDFLVSGKDNLQSAPQ